MRFAQAAFEERARIDTGRRMRLEEHQVAPVPAIAFVGAEEMIEAALEDLGGRKWQRICVADNGMGIAETDMPKIFLPF